MNKLLQVFILLLTNIFSFNALIGQNIWKIESAISDKSVLISDSFSAVSIRFNKNVKDLMVTINDHKYTLVADEHIDFTVLSQSQLIIENSNQIKFNCSKTTKIEVIYQKVSLLPQKNIRADVRAIDCELPPTIPPSFWRNGLANPKPNPLSTTVNHGIIHHSASGNGNVDYTNLVRNYYIQHTQVNGWDDIGYNYLIAANGTIYIGRDKQQLLVPDYQVLGAHFCGKNINTFGVCLIGDYTLLRPSDTMLASLKKLMGYIFYKANILGLDSTIHPLPNGNYLSNIAGHRQGCATACPGDSTFAIINALRLDIENQRKKCFELLKNDQKFENEIEVKIGLESINIHATKPVEYVIYTIDSKLISKSDKIEKDPIISIANLTQGFYIIVLNGILAKQFLKF